MKAKLASQDTFQRIADTVLKASTGDDTFVSFSDSDSSTLRFANNQVVQNVSIRRPSVSVRVAFGQKVGRVTTNRIDRNSLLRAVRRAEEIARLAPDDPEFLPSLSQQVYHPASTYKNSTADTTPIGVAKRTKPVIDKCEQNGLTGAGILTNSTSARGLAASSGLFAYEQSTSSTFSLTATAEDSTGWTMNSHRDIDRLGIEDRTQVAVNKALTSKNPREVAAGHHTVILEPSAVAGIFGPFFWSVGAKSYYKGDSPLAGKVGTMVFDGRLNVRTDPFHPDLLGSRFSGNGLANRTQVWVENGVLKQLYYDRFTAKEHGQDPNPRPSSPIVSFNGPVVGSVDDLIRQTKRGILITNFWYIRYVNRTDLTLTGMTRDGTFLVEDGKVVCGLRNFRFHDSPLRAFLNIDATTEPMEARTLERGKSLLPAVKLPDFYLSSVTKF
ncbi:MAG: TldD/PmbA family protein [Planctomycetes bacterium]|nr:TldD/PmbA family protein [Planctomycetota bacterium]